MGVRLWRASVNHALQLRLQDDAGLHHLAGETFRAEEEPREARLWGTVAESHERPGAGPG